MPLPSGTITFLFTDIEGSTKLWEQHPDAMRAALARHDALLRQTIEDNDGVVFKTVGDAFCAAFAMAPNALKAALTAHLLLLKEKWEETGPLRVRMGLHTGVAEERDGDYFGQTLNRVARLQGVGHGQQTLLSQTTYQLVCNDLPPDVMLQDMGQHRLKDLLAPEHVWQLLHPTLPAEFPALKSLDYLPTNLPAQVTSFIGRERETQEVKERLHQTRLLTLTGSGGSGKTRLSLQVAADLLEEYKEGVWLVELAALSDSALVPQTVAQALSIRETPGEPITTTLLSSLKDRQMLLVLDNCEHLLDASARLVDAILKACSKVSVLVSSREALGIAGEVAYRVPSLSLPEPANSYTREGLLQYEAVRLFVERATAVKADFALTNHNVASLASVCHRLDGIPLALELAAARVRSLPVQEINTRLDNQFRLLTGGSRTALPRQQTLRALIDWSYNLLNEREKTLLCRLSVFAGGWTLEAAEQVCTGENIEDWEVVDLLTALADKSLAVYAETEGKARYRLLETVRQYARDRLLEAGEPEALRRRHRDYFMVLAEEAEPKLVTREQTRWLQRLEEEHENLRVALEWSLLEETGSSAGLRLCGALQRFWTTRGHLSEGREWCVKALDKPGAQHPTRERAKTLNGAGVLASMQGDYADARPLFEASWDIQRERGDRNGIANALNNLGLVSCDQGDYASARTYYAESLTIQRERGDRIGIANSLHNLGIVACDQDDYASARAFLVESLDHFREIGEQRGIANSLNSLGIVARNQSDYASATAYYIESLDIKREIGDRRGVSNSLSNLGSLAYSQSDYTTAQAYHQESLAIKREIGDRSGIAASLNNLGLVASAQGDDATSKAYHHESLKLRREIKDRKGITGSLEAIATLTFRESKPEKAAMLYGVAEALREEIGSPLPPNERAQHDRNVSEVRQALGEAAFTAAWAAGRTMTWEQAVEYALQEEK